MRMNPLIIMAQYITTLTLGIARFHLCHSGQCVFGSHHYMTGGVMIGGIIYRNGLFRDASRPNHILDTSDLCTILSAERQTRLQGFIRACRHLAMTCPMPLRRPTKRRWNPWLE